MSPKLHIIDPCPESWDTMAGGERSRYCERCNLHVHNLEMMSATEVEQLLRVHNGRICGRGYQGTNGNLMLGTRPRRVSRVLVVALTAAMSVAIAPAQTLAAEQPTQSQRKREAGITIAISDATGAAISGAKITLESLLTGEVFRGATDNAGRWKAGGVPPGPYKLQISAVGFNNSESEVNLASNTEITRVLSVVATMGIVVQVAEVEPLARAEGSVVQIDPLPLLSNRKQGKHRP